VPPELDEDGLSKPRWGLGEVALGFVLAQLAASIAYIVFYALTHYDINAPVGVGGAVGDVTGQLANGAPPTVATTVPLGWTAVLQIPLWAGLVGVPVWAAARKGNGWRRDFRVSFRWFDAPVGVAIGVASQLLVVPALYWLLFIVIGRHDVSAAAREFTDRATDPLGVVLLLVIVGIGAPLAEELFFRGLTLRALRKRGLHWGWAVMISAVIFAAGHLQPLQFPALLVFGVILGLLVQRTNRLGPAVWAHLGFNVTAALTLVLVR